MANEHSRSLIRSLGARGRADGGIPECAPVVYPLYLLSFVPPFRTVRRLQRKAGRTNRWFGALGSGRDLTQVLCMSLPPLLSRIGSKKTRFFIANINQKDLVFLKGLLEAGKVVPVIDRRYPLSDAAEALRHLEQRHARGKIVLSVEHSSNAQ